MNKKSILITLLLSISIFLWVRWKKKMTKCVICGNPATWKCQHELTLAIRFYCNEHKPRLDEICKSFIFS